MSATLLDRSVANAPMTTGFVRISGFDVREHHSPSLGSGFAAAASNFRDKALPALSVKVPSTPPIQSAQPKAAGPTQPGSASNKKEGAPATPTSDQVGWKGLLEISRNSGMSGVVLGCRTKAEEERTDVGHAHVETCCTAHPSANVRSLVKSVVRGIKACQEPEKTSEGMGGTYFFMNENGRKVAILKPCDEEPLAPNNPKGYVGRALGDPGWKPTVRVGEAAMREVAAYLLDHGNFAKVPTSVLVRARHPIFCYNSRMSSVRASSLDLNGIHLAAEAVAAATGSNSCATIMEGYAAAHGAPTAPAKSGLSSGLASSRSISSAAGGAQAAAAAAVAGASVQGGPLPMKLGSLQEFVHHECDTSEMGPSRFSARDVHRIGILDIRLFNTDRHAGNMLVRVIKPGAGAGGVASSGTTGGAGRMGMGDQPQYELIPIDHGFCLPETLEAPYFEWLHWPQAMLPFTDEELAYIQRIDIESDKELLRRELPNLRPECLRVMELSTTLLKRGAEAGLTLFEIASIITRPFEGCDEEASDLEKFAAYARQAIEAMGESDSECEDEECLEEEEGNGCILEGDEDSLVDAEIDAEMAEQARQAGSGGTRGAGSSSREDESMMFDWDEEGNNTAYAKRRSGAMEPHSPGGASLTSSSSVSSADHMSPFGNGVSGGGGGAGIAFTPRAMVGGPLTPPSASGGSGRGGAAPMMVTPKAAPGLGVPTPFAPASVHADNYFMWRRMRSKQTAAAAKRHGHHRARPLGSKLCPSPQAYPPPVAAFSPEALNGLFSDMDERAWKRFMGVVEDQIGAALAGGKWKQSLKKESAVAMSCPRF